MTLCLVASVTAPAAAAAALPRCRRLCPTVPLRGAFLAGLRRRRTTRHHTARGADSNETAAGSRCGRRVLTERGRQKSLVRSPQRESERVSRMDRVDMWEHKIAVACGDAKFVYQQIIEGEGDLETACKLTCAEKESVSITSFIWISMPDNAGNHQQTSSKYVGSSAATQSAQLRLSWAFFISHRLAPAALSRCTASPSASRRRPLPRSPRQPPRSLASHFRSAARSAMDLVSAHEDSESERVRVEKRTSTPLPASGHC